MGIVVSLMHVVVEALCQQTLNVDEFKYPGSVIGILPQLVREPWLKSPGLERVIAQALDLVL